MRLLNTETGTLTWFNDGEIPTYAILSHVWNKDEQTFKDVEELGRKIHAPPLSLFHGLPPGLSAKLRGACEFAASLGYKWIWVDTCCIDKASSAELSEAINSMFAFYSNADVCIAYLADVPDGLRHLTEEGSPFRRSKWFTRGWTLQELIAPREVLFVSQGWKPFGTKADMAQTLDAITGVNKEVLTLNRPLSSISIAERMSWAAQRVTTRLEDRAYSLLGIFGVYIPTLYGEGGHAFRRLQEELLRSSPDQTLFAWEFRGDTTKRPPGLFADSPSRFNKEGLESLSTLTIEEIPFAAKAFRSALAISSAASKHESGATPSLHSEEPTFLPFGTPACSLTNYGIRARIPLLSRPAGPGHSGYAIAILAATRKSGYVGLVLERLLQAEIAHYALGTHETRLVHVGAHQRGEPSPDEWATDLDLAHDDAVIRWEDVYITTAEAWQAQVRPTMVDMPLRALSAIPVSDLNYFRTGHHHSVVTRRCLAIMNANLRQDICGIGDPSLRNEDVPDLVSRITENIPEELQQACTLWITHLPLSPPDTELLNALSMFTHEHLLHWIECLSFLRQLPVGREQLPSTYAWFSKYVPKDERLLRDACITIQTYQGALSTSTLQLYHQILPFEMPWCDLYRRSMEVSPPPIKLLSPRRNGWPQIPRELKSNHDDIRSIAFLPDNVHFICGSGGGFLTKWNSQTLRLTASAGRRNTKVHAVACSPDGRLVASSGEPAGVALWNVVLGGPWNVDSEAPLRVLKGQDSRQRALAFSPDSSCIAAGSDDNTVHIWSVATGETIHAVRGHTDWVNAIAFSPEGTKLASGSGDRTINIWNTTTGDAIHRLRGHESVVTSVSFSHDGSQIVSGCADNTVGIWNAATGEAIRALKGHTDIVTFVAFASHGAHVISGSLDGTIRTRGASTGNPISAFRSAHGKIWRMSISPDQTRLVSAPASGHTIEIWDADFLPLELVGHWDAVSAVAFAPDGETFVTSSYDTTMRLWKTRTAELLYTIPHYSQVEVARFSPDGTILATGSNEPTIRLFQTSAWSEVGTMTWPPNVEPSSMGSLAFSGDRSRIAGGGSNSVLVWDVNSQEQIAAFVVGYPVVALAFSLDMMRIATSSDSQHNGTHIWDVATGQRVAELQGLGGKIYSLEFSSDGRRVASRGHDGSVFVGSIPSPYLHDDPPAYTDEVPLRFSWHPDSGGHYGWLHFTAGANQESKPLFWLPEERRPSWYTSCYAWHGNVVVVGSENGMVTVVDVTEAVRSL